jgi:hypothetical protein
MIVDIVGRIIPEIDSSTQFFHCQSVVTIEDFLQT